MSDTRGILINKDAVNFEETYDFSISHTDKDGNVEWNAIPRIMANQLFVKATQVFSLPLLLKIPCYRIQCTLKDSSDVLQFYIRMN